MSNSLIKKLVIAGSVLFVILVFVISSCTIVQQRERGINYTLGQVKGDVIEPGVVFHAPFITQIKTYSIAPRNLSIKFSYGSDAALTKDNQSIGLEANVTYRYDEAKIKQIAMELGDSIIEDTFKRNLGPAIKTVIGKYSIYDVTPEQENITSEVEALFNKTMTQLRMPVIIDKVVVGNFDWSDSFDRAITATMEAAQAAKKAEQELKVAETEAQKVVATAKANLEAEKLNAEAIKIKADASAYEAQQIANNKAAYQAQWDYEVRLAEVNKWDGHYVPNNNYGPIPVSQDLPLQGKTR